jgi:hypothetical protein
MMDCGRCRPEPRQFAPEGKIATTRGELLPLGLYANTHCMPKLALSSHGD